MEKQIKDSPPNIITEFYRVASIFMEPQSSSDHPPQERYSPIYSIIGSGIAILTLCWPMYLTLEYSSFTPKLEVVAQRTQL
jgi:hypothetical protein